MPPQTRIVPPSEDCAPKKVTGSVPLECSSRPETPKIQVITLGFESKDCFFFADFVLKTHFCGVIPEFVEICAFFEFKSFFSLHPKIRGNSRIFGNEVFCFLVHNFGFEVLKFSCPPPPPPPPQSRYSGAGPDLQIAKTIFGVIHPKCWRLVGQMIF